MTVAHVYTVAFEGVEAREVDVQVHIGEGTGGIFNLVGLGDKAVGERSHPKASSLTITRKDRHVFPLGKGLPEAERSELPRHYPVPRIRSVPRTNALE
jgi:magnesium chelatase family protein